MEALRRLGAVNAIPMKPDVEAFLVRDVEVISETRRRQAMRRMVRKGATIVLGVGFARTDSIDWSETRSGWSTECQEMRTCGAQRLAHFPFQVDRVSL